MSQISAVSSAFSTVAAGASSSSLEYQLTRYQKELSDCVNCESAKTAEGKAAIQDAVNKISAVKARIDEVAAGKTVNQPAAIDRVTAASVNGDQGSFANGGSGLAAASSPATSSTSTTGSLLDVFA